MKLQRAEEILALNIKQRSPSMPPDVLNALRLGRAALERLMVGRNNPDTKWNDPLPGEDLPGY